VAVRRRARRRGPDGVCSKRLSFERGTWNAPPALTTPHPGTPQPFLGPPEPGRLPAAGSSVAAGVRGTSRRGQQEAHSWRFERPRRPPPGVTERGLGLGAVTRLGESPRLGERLGPAAPTGEGKPRVYPCLVLLDVRDVRPGAVRCGRDRAGRRGGSAVGRARRVLPPRPSAFPGHSPPRLPGKRRDTACQKQHPGEDLPRGDSFFLSFSFFLFFPPNE